MLFIIALLDSSELIWTISRFLSLSLLIKHLFTNVYPTSPDFQTKFQQWHTI